MFTPKTAKEDKSDYTVFHPYPFIDYPPLGYLTGENIPAEGCQCVSIDVGLINFAVRIETRYPDGEVKPIYFDKINFEEYDNISERSGTCTLNPQIITSSRKYFHDLLPFLKATRLVVIERQMPINIKSGKMAQHILTLFLEHVGSFDYPCVITDVNSQLKSKVFNAGKLSKNDLKAWAIEKALEILKFRGDEESIKSILYHKGKTKTKADDLADTVLQLEALIIIWGGLTKLNSDSMYQTLELNPEAEVQVLSPDEIQDFYGTQVVLELD